VSLPFSPAAERNQDAILEALARRLPAALNVLEIASGTGQHAFHFASACPAWRWQPTDTDSSLLRAIDERCAGLPNVLPARALDVHRPPWLPVTDKAAPFGAVVCANLLHIAPWSACPALMQGAAAHLDAGGLLILYGPYRRDGVPTAPGNEAFDADLKARDPQWGLRSLTAVEREAATAGLALQEVLEMPANNLLVVFRKP